MVRLIALLVALLVALPGPLNAQTRTATISVAEIYRQAAERWKGRALEERVKRQAAEADKVDAEELVEHWRQAAEAKTEARTPEWVWPVTAVAMIAAFAGGFALAHQDRRE